MSESRVISTADALRMLEYGSPLSGWHRHGLTLIPTDSCHACNYLKRQQTSPDAVKEIPENDETAAQSED